MIFLINEFERRLKESPSMNTKVYVEFEQKKSNIGT